ncbi:MAG TPA: MFS transporter [Hyphomonadaceae bacterium]|nr:MFS transporter [Hyphomonadaceae bacterium]HPN06428.1 MFS transporter [Hyphomonadaceae bacterium]
MGTHTGVAGADTPASDSQGHLTGYGTKQYRSYVLNALLFVYILNFLDRGLLGIVSEPVMNELGITDGDFGLLTGIGFALFYSIVGIPLARYAEVGNRTWIMTICIALWSAATALSGMVGPVEIGGVVISGFVMLLLCRVLVGVGEAGCTPPANSIIADYYPPARRSTALGYYAMGVTAGTLSANLIGGPVADAYGWRVAFMLIGAAGVVVAIAFRLTVKEPPRGYSDPPGTVRAQKATFGDALKELSSKRSFWLMAAGATLASFCGYGITTFQTSFLIRTHGVTLTEATLLFNVPSAFAASVGVVMTGWLAEKTVKRHPNAIAWLPAIGLVACVPFYLLGFSAENKWVALAGICMGAGIKYGYLAAQYTIGQGVVGARTRATATAILLFIINLLGYGAGPPFIGYVSDILFSMSANAEGFTDLARASCKGAALQALPEAAQAFCRGAEAKALQNSLLITSVLYALPAVFFMMCIKTLQKDLIAK